jgi:Sortase domain
MGYSGHTGPMPVVPRMPDDEGRRGSQGLPGKRGLPQAQGLPEDWWDPGWQAVQSPGAVPLQPEILKPSGNAWVEAVGDEAPPSWGQVLGNTFSLWAGRHLRWLRRSPEPSPGGPLGWSPGWPLGSSPGWPQEAASERSPRRPRGRIVAAAALAAGLTAVGIGAAGLVTDSVSATPAVQVARPAPIAAPAQQTAPAGQAASAGQGGPAAASAGAAGAVRPVAKPVWVSVPAIGIKKTSLIHLGLTRSGALQVPDTTTVAGWFTGGPRPGATGSAVIAGHVDSKTGPGIFFWLRVLKPGDKIYIGRADGTMAVFAVTRVHQYAKDKFPTAAVYGAIPDPELRLITCGGIFDRSIGSYLSNIVVFARLAG